MKRVILLFLMFGILGTQFHMKAYAENELTSLFDDNMLGDLECVSEEEQSEYEAFSVYLEENGYEPISMEEYFEAGSDVDKLNLQLKTERTRTIASMGEQTGVLSSGGNDWYQNTGTSLPQNPKYSKYNLLKVVKKGDIIYDKLGGSGVTGHVAIVEGLYYNSTYSTYYIRVIEAIPGAGVCRGIVDDERIDDRESSVYRVSASSTVVNNAVAFCVGQLGKGYFCDLQKDTSASSTNWYCSELVWAAYKNQGIDIETDGVQNEPGVTPRDIIRSNNVSKITFYTFAQPQITSATSTSCNQATINWNSVSGATSYYVYQCLSKNGIYTKVATVSTTSYTASTLTPGTTYYYRIVAHKSGVDSNDSKPMVVTTYIAPPTIYSYTALSSSSIKLSWGQMSGAVQYEVYRANSANGSYTKIATCSSATYTDTGLTSKKTYYYKVKVSIGYSSENQRTQSDYGGYVSVTTN